MSTDISTSQDFIAERTEKTRAAQSTLTTDAAWTWPMKTLAQWDADLTSLDATVNGSLAKVTAALGADLMAARGILDGRLAAIHNYTVLAVGVMRVRAAAVPGLRGMVADLKANGSTRKAIEKQADALVAAWEEWEQQTAQPFSPGPGKTLADFKLLLEGAAGSGQAANPMLATLKKNHTTARTKWRRSVGQVNALFARLEDECVAWYAEATKVFPDGTPEGNMIRELVPTDYNPATPAPPTPPPPGP